MGIDGLKGIHAILTSIFILFLVYVSYGFVNNFFGTITDTIYNGVLWASYIIIIIVGTLGIPMLIAFSEDSDANIVSALIMFGFYFGGVIFTRILLVIIQIFTGGNGTVAGILSEPLHIQIMTVLWILGMAITLFMLPIAAGTMPQMVFDTAKDLVSKEGTA